MTTMTETQAGKAMAASRKAEIEGPESTRPGHVFTPPVDIFETDAAITVLADMPGVRPDGLTIDLRDNVLTIDGAVTPVEGDDERPLMREYETGAFRREFRLSNAIDQDRIEARLRDGVLHLTLPKAAAARPRRITVTAG